MDVPPQVCALYVDYDGLLVSLSHTFCFSIATLVSNLLIRAKSQFRIERALVLGNWSSYDERLHLEEQGVLCQSASSLSFHDVITDEAVTMAQGQAILLLIAGRFTDNELLSSLHAAGHKIVLWTIEPISENSKALSYGWEVITVPSETASWPRQVMLQALILAVDALSDPSHPSFDAQQLYEALHKEQSFQEHTWAWITIALRERILVQRRTAPIVANYVFSLRREHTLVQEAFQIRERILSTMYALSLNRPWVAFSVLEKALGSSWLLAGGKREESIRYAWLELFVLRGVLVSKCIAQPGSAFQVTTLRLDESSTLSARVQAQQQRNLAQLVLTIQRYLDENRVQRVPLAYLMRTLTGPLTRVEVRSILSTAEQAGIITIEKLPPRREQHPPTIARLQRTHPFVLQIQDTKASVRACLAAFYGKRSGGVSADLLHFVLEQNLHLSEDDARFWIARLQEAGSLQKQNAPLSPEDTSLHLLYWQGATNQYTSGKEDERGSDGRSI